MCHSLLNSRNFFALLQQIDGDLMKVAQKAACPVCRGRLDRADYPRKPRGINRSELGDEYCRRLSLCCSRDGCRRRMTPDSVRFLGRKVYLAVIVVLAAALDHGASARRVAALAAHLPVSRRTVDDWRRWWRERFVLTRFWQSAQGLLATPLLPASLPGALLEQFAAAGTLSDALASLLQFIAPVTAWPGSALIEG